MAALPELAGDPMTDKQFDLGPQGKPVKKAGWHSWRHPTRKEQDEARERYFATHATARARIARRELRQKARQP